jgi:hypothetical protein
MPPTKIPIPAHPPTRPTGPARPPASNATSPNTISTFPVPTGAGPVTYPPKPSR